MYAIAYESKVLQGVIMPAVVIIGAQWGDEGKGKATDLLAEHIDYVVKFNGGNNAGHTIVVGDTTYKDYELSKVEPDGIRILHSAGAAKIPFEKLSPDLQKKYGFDPKKAAAFREKKEAEAASRNDAEKAAEPKMKPESAPPAPAPAAFKGSRCASWTGRATERAAGARRSSTCPWSWTAGCRPTSRCRVPQGRPCVTRSA